MKKLSEIFTTKRRAIYIAEIGLNHNGDADIALAMIDAAAGAGADAVKFQTFVPELLISEYSGSLLKNGNDDLRDSTAIDFFKRFVLKASEYKALKKRAGELGIVFFSTPFDIPSVELLEELGVPLYKTASSEITNHALIREIAKTGKPAIMSTGISNENEIDEAVAIFKQMSDAELSLLHCVSLYPLDPKHANLMRIKTLSERFGLAVGFSDHTAGCETAMVAAAYGARIFEKHFTIDRNFDCADKEVSLAPDEFARMIEAVESAIDMGGSGAISFGPEESVVARAARRSLFAAKDIPAGKILEESDMAALRPGVGISQAGMKDIIGKKSITAIEAKRLMRREFFE